MTGGRPEEAELIEAAMRGDLKKIELLLSMDRPLRRRSTLLGISDKRVPIDINLQDTMGRTALHWIANQGHEDCVDIVMKHPGTKSLVSNKDGRTPLHEAAMKGHAKIVEKFFTYDIFRSRENIDKVDHYQRTALHWAALGGHDTTLEVLIKNGADVKKISKDEKTALHVVINADNDAAKWKLLRAWIAHGGDEGLIRALLDDNKIQVDTEDENKQTLLFRALVAGHHDIVKLLIEKGADMEELLSWAARRGHENAVELLVENGANIAVKDTFGRTPLSWAAMEGHESVVKLLVEKGADMEAKDMCSQTPLSRAAGSGHASVVKLLAEKGADIEAKDNSGETPLSFAAVRGHESVVKLLVEKGADIEAKNKVSQTPLSLAVGMRHGSVIKLLVEQGADIEAKDKNGQTPLSEAVRMKHEGITNLLQNKSEVRNLLKMNI
ncbi:hypothetical protein ACHAPV_001921 [Trichoderma viride]